MIATGNNLTSNTVGDESLPFLLSTLPQIKRLKLDNCEITSQGIQRISKKLIETNHKVVDICDLHQILINLDLLSPALLCYN